MISVARPWFGVHEWLLSLLALVVAIHVSGGKVDDRDHHVRRKAHIRTVNQATLPYQLSGASLSAIKDEQEFAVPKDLQHEIAIRRTDSDVNLEVLPRGTNRPGSPEDLEHEKKARKQVDEFLGAVGLTKSGEEAALIRRDAVAKELAEAAPRAEELLEKKETAGAEVPEVKGAAGHLDPDAYGERKAWRNAEEEHAEAVQRESEVTQSVAFRKMEAAKKKSNPHMVQIGMEGLSKLFKGEEKAKQQSAYELEVAVKAAARAEDVLSKKERVLEKVTEVPSEVLKGEKMAKQNAEERVVAAKKTSEEARSIETYLLYRQEEAWSKKQKKEIELTQTIEKTAPFRVNSVPPAPLTMSIKKAAIKVNPVPRAPRQSIGSRNQATPRPARPLSFSQAATMHKSMGEVAKSRVAEATMAQTRVEEKMNKKKHVELDFKKKAEKMQEKTAKASERVLKAKGADDRKAMLQQQRLAMLDRDEVAGKARDAQLKVEKHSKAFEDATTSVKRAERVVNYHWSKESSAKKHLHHVRKERKSKIKREIKLARCSVNVEATSKQRVRRYNDQKIITQKTEELSKQAATSEQASKVIDTNKRACSERDAKKTEVDKKLLANHEKLDVLKIKMGSDCSDQFERLSLSRKDEMEKKQTVEKHHKRLKQHAWKKAVANNNIRSSMKTAMKVGSQTLAATAERDAENDKVTLCRQQQKGLILKEIQSRRVVMNATRDVSICKAGLSTVTICEMPQKSTGCQSGGGNCKWVFVPGKNQCMNCLHGYPLVKELLPQLRVDGGAGGPPPVWCYSDKLLAEERMSLESLANAESHVAEVSMKEHIAGLMQVGAKEAQGKMAKAESQLGRVKRNLAAVQKRNGKAPTGIVSNVQQGPGIDTLQNSKKTRDFHSAARVRLMDAMNKATADSQQHGAKAGAEDRVRKLLSMSEQHGKKEIEAEAAYQHLKSKEQAKKATAEVSEKTRTERKEHVGKQEASQQTEKDQKTKQKREIESKAAKEIAKRKKMLARKKSKKAKKKVAKREERAGKAKRKHRITKRKESGKKMKKLRADLQLTMQQEVKTKSETKGKSTAARAESHGKTSAAKARHAAAARLQAGAVSAVPAVRLLASQEAEEKKLVMRIKGVHDHAVFSSLTVRASKKNHKALGTLAGKKGEGDQQKEVPSNDHPISKGVAAFQETARSAKDDCPAPASSTGCKRSGGGDCTSVFFPTTKSCSSCMSVTGSKITRSLLAELTVLGTASEWCYADAAGPGDLVSPPPPAGTAAIEAAIERSQVLLGDDADIDAAIEQGMKQGIDGAGG